MYPFKDMSLQNELLEFKRQLGYLNSNINYFCLLTCILASLDFLETIKLDLQFSQVSKQLYVFFCGYELTKSAHIS